MSVAMALTRTRRVLAGESALKVWDIQAESFIWPAVRKLSTVVRRERRYSRPRTQAGIG